MNKVESFPPVDAPQARRLILGSMPGKVSLSRHQYYAHPRNAFWPIMGELLGFNASAEYSQRLEMITQAGIALWDVMRRCSRASSLDADIVTASIEPNDFARFFSRHPGIQQVYFNGAKAEQIYGRYVLPLLQPEQQALPTLRLPSTSPAHASMGYAQKLAAWHRLLV